MKRFSPVLVGVFLLLFTISVAFASPRKMAQPAEAPVGGNISGSILETMNSGGYTYVYLKKKDDSKIWVAAPEFKAVVGEKVTLQGGTEMVNFQSSTLKRTFDKLVFSNGLVEGVKVSKPVAVKDEKKSPGSKGAAVKSTNEKITVAKATGANAFTVVEIFKNGKMLNKKKVVVNAKVVKVSAGIMNKNWIHIQDGTGSPESGNNDLVVTSDKIPSMGDVVTVKGTLYADKDFGSGYKYSVIIEEASFTVLKK